MKNEEWETPTWEKEASIPGGDDNDSKRNLKRDGRDVSDESRPDKKNKVGYKLTVVVWRADGAADAMTKDMVEELEASGPMGFSSALIPFVPKKPSAAIVQAKGVLGRLASGWGLNLQGVTLPNPQCGLRLNSTMTTLFEALLTRAEVMDVYGIDRWLIPVGTLCLRLLGHVCFAILITFPILECQLSQRRIRAFQESW
jgi:hypothetical protein